MRGILLLFFVLVSAGSFLAQPQYAQAAVCNSFTATPDSFAGSGTTTLAWDIESASTVTIDNGVGQVEQAFAAVEDFVGSIDVFVNADTTFTLTADDPDGGIDTCFVSVTTTAAPPLPVCDVFTATPDSFVGSGTSTLSWEVTGADTVSIDNGVGAVALVGSVDRLINSDITFEITASNVTGTTTCAVPLTVMTSLPSSSGGGSSATRVPQPSCVYFSASKDEVTEGDIVTLSFETKNATKVIIYEGKVPDNKIVYQVSPGSSKAGAVAVTVSKDTTYTLVAEKGSRSDDCSVSIDTVSSLAFGGSGQNEGAVLLTEVPETGYEMSTASKVMLYVLLASGTLFVLFMGMHVGRLGVFATQSTVQYGAFTPISAAADHALRVHKTRATLIIASLVVLIILLIVQLI